MVVQESEALHFHALKVIPVKILPPAKSVSLGNGGPIPPAKAATQGRVLPAVKNSSNNSNVTIGSIEYVSLRKTLENLQVEIRVCLDCMVLGTCLSSEGGLLGHGPLNVSPSALEDISKAHTKNNLRTMKGKAHLVGAEPKRAFKPRRRYAGLFSQPKKAHQDWVARWAPVVSPPSSALVDAPVGGKVLGTLVHTLADSLTGNGGYSSSIVVFGSLFGESEAVESGIAASDVVMGVAPSLACSLDSIPVGACEKEAVSFGSVIPLVELDIGIVEGVEGLVECSLEDSLDFGIAKDSWSARPVWRCLILHVLWRNRLRL
ncbi:hypothetical protein FH972_002148 [Carpinus fangiana]|uniref:Uncharacterized protein n=1 Tax=Carpinus fangiana TaxID=176857 RepID=A0A5N6QFV1_9ROSI|nr:hypothetical protein FH972_002148 [Carpinus fangiana]